MNLQILHSGALSAADNMKKDEALLKTLKGPILRFYDWEKPSATYGYFIQPEDFLNPNPDLDVAKRPTGGGVLFHAGDFTFSLLVPSSHPSFSLNTLENYFRVNSAVCRGIQAFFNRSDPELFRCEPMKCRSRSPQFCMAEPIQHDVMINGKKVAGGAQRRTLKGFLHQGTISLSEPPEGLLRSSLKPSVYEAIRQNSFYLIEGKTPPLEMTAAKSALAILLQQQFDKMLTRLF